MALGRSALDTVYNKMGKQKFASMPMKKHKMPNGKMMSGKKKK